MAFRLILSIRQEQITSHKKREIGNSHQLVRKKQERKLGPYFHPISPVARTNSTLLPPPVQQCQLFLRQGRVVIYFMLLALFLRQSEQVFKRGEPQPNSFFAVKVEYFFLSFGDLSDQLQAARLLDPNCRAPPLHELCAKSPASFP